MFLLDVFWVGLREAGTGTENPTSDMKPSDMGHTALLVCRLILCTQMCRRGRLSSGLR